MKQKQRKSFFRLAIEFVKLQLAGNVLFWGTYLGYFIFDQWLHWPQFIALAVASIIAHALFFIVDKEWVFADKSGKRKSSNEITRFIMFMGFNYILNLLIIEALSKYAGLSPYIGQFVSAFFFTAWNFIGLRFWVFQVPQHHAITVKVPSKVRHAKRRR